MDLKKARTMHSDGKQELLSPLSDSVSFPSVGSAAAGGGGGTVCCVFQGCVKRKTLIKDGRRPAMSGWQRYWLQLWGSQLVYFLPRTLVTKGLERKDFRADPCKCHSVESWVVMVPDSGLGATDELSFQLADPTRRSVYRFRTPTDQYGAADRAAGEPHIVRVDTAFRWSENWGSAVQMLLTIWNQGSATKVCRPFVPMCRRF